MFYPQISSVADTYGLILEYLFEDTSTDWAIDTSGNNLHGALEGSNIHYEPGRVGFGLAFNGIDDFINVGVHDLLHLNKYTIMAWIKYNKLIKKRQEIMEKAGSYWMNVRMGTKAVRSGGFYGGCTNANWVFVDSTIRVPEDTWMHVASVYTGSQLKIFVNGQLVRRASISGTVCVNQNPLTIGAKYIPTKGIAEAFFDGLIDEVRIYNRPLSKFEIQYLMTQP
jgi:hypothetical protein